MINSKESFKYYLECDRLALGKESLKPRALIDDIWKYEILLRKCEYFKNCGKTVFHKVILKYYRFRLVRLGQKLGFSIGENVCGPGLAIVHYGLTVINQHASIGENCRIHEGVTIGSNAFGNEAPRIGNNVYIASGAKIIGDIDIADDVVIGANAVVVRSVLEPGITVAGVPARKVSDNDSTRYLIKATELIKNRISMA